MNPRALAATVAGTIAATTILLVFGTGMFLLACVFAALVWVAVVLEQRDDALADFIGEVFTNAELKAENERLNVEADALHQENCQLHDELAQARLWAGDGPRLRVVATPRSWVDPRTDSEVRADQTDAPVASDDDWFARLYDERGNVR